MEIRILSPEHSGDCHRLEAECFSTPWSLEQIADSLHNPLSVFLGAYEENSLVGYIGLYILPGTAEVLNTAVSPEYRKRGIATLLMNRVKTLAAERECSGIFLEVRESNLPAKSLYEKCGFEGYSVRKNYYQNPIENAVLMKFTLQTNTPNTSL